MPRKQKVERPSDTRSRKERFEDYLAEYQSMNSTGHVKALKTFAARIHRKGDQAEHVRGVETVRVGDVVSIPIDRDENAEQGAGVVAWMRAAGKFEPTDEPYSEPPLDDLYHGTMTTREAFIEEHKHDAADPDARLTLTRGELQSLVGAAVAEAMKASPAVQVGAEVAKALKGGAVKSQIEAAAASAAAEAVAAAGAGAGAQPTA